MKIKIEGGIYFDSSNAKYHVSPDTDYWYRDTFPLYKFRQRTEPVFYKDEFLVVPHSFEVEIPELKELHDKFAAAVMELDQRINSLLALEA